MEAQKEMPREGVEPSPLHARCASRRPATIGNHHAPSFDRIYEFTNGSAVSFH